MPETCRCWLTKWTEDKQCIKLVFITWMYRDARSTKKKKVHLTPGRTHFCSSPALRQPDMIFVIFSFSSRIPGIISHRPPSLFQFLIWRCLHTGNGGPGSSVGIATDYGLEGPGSNPGGDEIFRPSRPALGPTQPPVQWVPRLSRG